ncbi:hypothetical protein J2X92_004033 [Variovorax paradoxus]|nr:hypothetical protein [Variovorax paradoxus]
MKSALHCKALFFYLLRGRKAPTVCRSRCGGCGPEAAGTCRPASAAPSNYLSLGIGSFTDAPSIVS